jgi:hypothetical protein
MSWRPKWQNFKERDWGEIRAAWVANVPKFPGIGAPPDPGLDGLGPLQALIVPDNRELLPDFAGLRTNALWESVFLFHKCAHTGLAAQRLGQEGMHSWSLFNAYHSAYLGARGIMGLLGMVVPTVRGIQVAIDLFPEPVKQKRGRFLALPQFQDFLIVRLPTLIEQRYLWEGFQRVLNMSRAECWDAGLRDDLLALSFGAISPPRNHYLYKPGFWPLPDLMADAQLAEFNTLFGTELDVDETGFLLRLCFSVYRIFAQLMEDLAKQSGPIREQFEASRVFASTGLSVLDSYVNFISQLPPTRLS